MKLIIASLVLYSDMRHNDHRDQLFSDVISQYSGLISKVCYIYATDEDNFKDLYQESLINVWRGIDSWRGDASLSSWLYRTSINTCLTHLRRNKKHKSDMPLDSVPEPIADDTDKLAQLKELYRLIGQLGEMDKAIIMMWLDEKSYDEIAEVTGLKRNTVATRIRRIKERLVKNGNQ